MEDQALESGEAAGDDGKFGMFLGVFTPSILTILGVIMYQRLGWVIGNSGILGAVGVIVLAHVISVTTGLSVASIATNRTVRTGGNYYIISRSLGLSIGGTIGLALYFALALGVSLYLIGFAEAVIAATGFSPMENPKDNIRIIGSAACIGLAALTFWSTSIALKSQLFVLAAILLSLFSILMGEPLAADAAVWTAGPIEDGNSFAVVFAVFFPAVTGFTAGVGMSGDLKNPKRAIPVGTVAAILTGFIVYVALAAFIALRAPADVLASDYNVLLRMARWDWMVTLGVAAATLSSALGSILGAPRTLQALAFDGIVFKFLGRGRGEPRVALFVTLVIAECGILVGELDVVGAVISMFFLSCYGVLCLACGLERWASPDFRPQFKVPVGVSLVGAFACFMVMFQINPGAMFGALALMVLFYVFLKRRQLSLGAGDTWAGVWSAVVRMGLIRLRQSESVDHRRNWRPNMIVVSRDRTRSGLIDFGRGVVGDRGILTHFELVEGGERKARVDKELETQHPGLFARIQGCEEVFQSIPPLVTSFGFAGMETNMLLLGWPRTDSTAGRYGAMIKALARQDVGCLMLRYDTVEGFRDRARIDLWWDGMSGEGHFLLTLLHLLSTQPGWKNARVRLLVNTRVGADELNSKQKLEKILSEARVKAEPMLLAPLPAGTLMEDRVRRESSGADIVMIAANMTADDSGEGFVSQNSRLAECGRNTLLVCAPKIFREGDTVFEKTEPVLPSKKVAENNEPVVDVVEETPDRAQAFALGLPEKPELASVMARLEEQLRLAVERLQKNFDEPAFKEEAEFLEQVVSEIEAIQEIERRLLRRGKKREVARGLLNWANGRFSTQVSAHAGAFTRKKPKKRSEESALVGQTAWEENFREGLGRLRTDLTHAVAQLPPYVSVKSVAQDWQSLPDDASWVKRKKFRRRILLKLGFAPPHYRVPMRAFATQYLGARLLPELLHAVESAAIRRLDVLSRVRRLVQDTERMFLNLLSELDQDTDEQLEASAFSDAFVKEHQGLEELAFGALSRFKQTHDKGMDRTQIALFSAAQRLSDVLVTPEVLLGRERPQSADKRQVKRLVQDANMASVTWEQQHLGMANALTLDLTVASISADARRSLSQLYHRIQREVDTGPLASIAQAKEIIARIQDVREVHEHSQEFLNGEDSQTEGDGAEVDAEEKKEVGGKDGDSAEGAENLEAMLSQAFLTAADDLRQTWDAEYRPDPEEMVEPLLLGLARSVDRLPEVVSTIDEAALAAALGGQPKGNTLRYPSRRLAQTFLESRIAQPARAAVLAVPAQVEEAQAVLVDSVRLIAFELEQAATGEDLDEMSEEFDEAIALGGVLDERAVRLDHAVENMRKEVEVLRKVLMDDSVAALDELRGAAVGSATLAQPARKRSLLKLETGAARFPLVSKAKKDAGDKLGGAFGLLRGTRSAPRSQASTLADQLQELRLQLLPGQQVSLPLIYRRIFGRAPLETAKLLRGRDEALSHAERLADRFTQGRGGAVAIIGLPRSGRTSLATVLARRKFGDKPLVRIQAPPGGSGDGAAIDDAVREAVGGREGQSAEGALRAMPPGAVILIEELGRWMERAPGGAGGLERWRRIWRRLGSRHLFVVTATPYAWAYANQAAGLGESILGTVDCGPLDTSTMAEMLLLRQKTSEFELEFESTEEVWKRPLLGRQLVQLRRIHERSRGNIGDALEIWRRSICKVGERRVVLSVAREPQSRVFGRLPAHWYATLGVVALHRTLGAAKAARILRMSREEALGTLGDLERAGLLQSDRTGSYNLDPLMQPYLLDILIRKGVLSS